MMEIASNQLPYFVSIVAPPVLSLLYVVSVQAFLAGWHECSWTHLAKPTTIRFTLVIIALAIVATFPTTATNEDGDTTTTTMTTYLLPAIVIPILSFISMYRTRKHFIQGPVPKYKNMNGKVVLITGSNAGIGKETARQMLNMGANVIMACRNEKRGKDAMEDILKTINEDHDRLLKSSFKSARERLSFLQCDVSDFESVRKAVVKFNTMDLPLHVLINNAGIMMGQRKTTTGDGKGLELTMTCNHLGHFLLTNLLLPKMRVEEDARVVIVTSSTYVLASSIDLQDLNCEHRQYTMFSQYAQSKLANILMGKELLRREMDLASASAVHNNLSESKNQNDNNHDKKGDKNLFPVSVFMVHPGLVRTDVVRNMPWYLKYPNMVFAFVMVLLQKSPPAGAYTNVYCATSDEVKEHNGGYFSNSQVFPVNDYANDMDAAHELWKISENLVGLNK